MNKLIYLLSVFAVVASILLTSCDPKDPPVDDAPVEKYTVYVGMNAEPDRLNPLLTTSGYSRQVYEQLFLALVEMDPITFESVPGLAKARPEVKEITEGPHAGGLSYTYELYDNITWSDGTPLTVKDVEFAFKLLFNNNVAEAASMRGFYTSVVRFDVDPANERRFTITTNEKYINGEAALNSMQPLPAHTLDPENLLGTYTLNDILANSEELSEEEPMKKFAEQIVSASFSREGDKLLASGPYVLGKWEEGQLITMARNDNWWVDELAGGHPTYHAYPDSIVFRIIADQATAITALKDGLVDVLEAVDAKTFVDLREGNDYVKENFNFFTPDMFAYYYVAINNGDVLLADKQVRRALAHLLDIDILIERGFFGLATPVNGPVLPGKSYYAKDLPIIPLDLDESRRLLAEAGWEDTNNDGTLDKEIDGEQVEMKLEYIVTPGGRFGAILSSLLKDNAEQVGIDITIIEREFRTMMSEDVATRNYQLFGAGARGLPIPDDFKQLWHTSSNTPSGTNRVQFGNAETDALIDAIRVELDEEKRNAMYREFQEIVYEEQPMLFLFIPQNRILISKRFKTDVFSIAPGYQVSDFRLAK
jgi:peptide/nickel transport system substrate-binding protein